MTKQDLLEYLTKVDSIINQAKKEIEEEAKNTIPLFVALCVNNTPNKKDFRLTELPQKTKDEINALFAKLRKSIFDITDGAINKAKSASMNLNGVQEYLDEFDLLDTDFKKNIATNTSYMAHEWEALVAIMLVANSPISNIISRLKGNVVRPFSMSEFLTNKIPLNAIRIKKDLHRGKGVAKNSMVQIWKNVDYQVMYGYNWYNYAYWKRNGAIGFASFTTSSNPCSTCTDLQNAGVRDYSAVPVHVNCRCVEYPVYS